MTKLESLCRELQKHNKLMKVYNTFVTDQLELVYITVLQIKDLSYVFQITEAKQEILASILFAFLL